VLGAVGRSVGVCWLLVCWLPLIEVEVVVEALYFSFPGTLVYLPTYLPAYARYGYLPA
jgi:hypothetical protein